MRRDEERERREEWTLKNEEITKIKADKGGERDEKKGEEERQKEGGNGREGLRFPSHLPVYKHWTTGLVLLIMEVGPYH